MSLFQNESSSHEQEIAWLPEHLFVSLCAFMTAVLMSLVGGGSV